jgi:hypothetical protein
LPDISKDKRSTAAAVGPPTTGVEISRLRSGSWESLEKKDNIAMAIQLPRFRPVGIILLKL